MSEMLTSAERPWYARTVRRRAGTREAPAHPPGCPCPACHALECHVRPRFFAGQLLTEAELTALQDYVIAKHQLHNRYLHGPGVVCGLEVGCGECGDDVVVSPGYAIDPCGRDIIVPAAAGFDILEAIQRCKDAERARPDCVPPLPPPPKPCDDDERWCVWLRYVEHDVRPVTPLAAAPKRSCTCGGATCRCNGNGNGHPGWSCTCGASGSRATGTCGCEELAAAERDLPPGCEPTRTYECFEIGVCRDDDCGDLAVRLAGSMPARVIACVRAIMPAFGKRLTGARGRAVARLALGDSSVSSDAAAYEGVCGLYDAVRDLYLRDPLRTHCALPDEFGEIDVARRGSGEAEATYGDRLVNTTDVLTTLVAAYVRECVCHALLPPCGSEPCDDRLIVACATVRNDKVIDVCNFDCRRYSGSFVTWEYWLPVGAIAGSLIARVCCAEWLSRYPERRLSMKRAFARVDPDERVRSALVRDDFAVLGDWVERARQVGDRLRKKAGGLVPDKAGDVSLSPLVGAPAAKAGKRLEDAGVHVREVEVEDATAVPIGGVGLFPAASRGDRLVQYVHRGRVVGYGREA